MPGRVGQGSRLRYSFKLGEISHWLNLKTLLASSKIVYTDWKWLVCFVQIRAKTITLLKEKRAYYYRTDERIASTDLWNVSDIFRIAKDIFVKWRSSWRDMNAIYHDQLPRLLIGNRCCLHQMSELRCRRRQSACSYQWATSGMNRKRSMGWFLRGR